MKTNMSAYPALCWLGPDYDSLIDEQLLQCIYEAPMARMSLLISLNTGTYPRVLQKWKTMVMEEILGGL